MDTNTYRRNQYTGSFIVAGQAINGYLIHDKKEGAIILNLEREYKKENVTVESFGDLDIITGKLNIGTKVILYNNKCTGNTMVVPRYQKIQFSSSYMVWTDDEKTNPFFNEFVFTLENALEWSGLSSFDDNFIKGLKLLEEPESKTFEWFGASITFTPSLNSWNHFPRGEKINIVERLMVSIATTEKNSLDYFISIRDKVMSMISFAIKDNVNVEKQYCIDYDIIHFYGDYKEYEKFSCYTSEPRRSILHTYSFNYNFTLSQLNTGEDIGDILNKLSPVFNLYLSLFKYRDMPQEMVFLNIVQAVETFHARFFYNDDKRKYVDSVIKKYGSSPSFDSIKQLLLSDNQANSNTKSIYLVSRINDLLVNSNVRLFLHYCSGQNKSFAQQVVLTRNYYTHYSEKKEAKAFTGKKLAEAIFVLKLLLEYNICLLLGIDNKEMIQEELSSFRTSQYISNIQSSQSQIKI